MKLATKLLIFCLMAFTACECARSQKDPGGKYTTWESYDGGPGALHYSALKQINQGNVSHLKIAWEYKTGGSFNGSLMECNPIVIGNVLYATTPDDRLLALNAANGKLIWNFNPWGSGKQVQTKQWSRGVTYWSHGDDQRIFFSAGHNLYAIDANTGKPEASFGRAGHIDLREGLGRNPAGMEVTMSSPGVIYKNLIIVGSSVAEDLPAAPGDIRAYDVRTGKMVWIFHTIPHPGEFGYDTWPRDAWSYIGGANAWGGLSVDTKRGLVFAGTGSAAFDFYGSDRIGDNLFADCVLALDAETGKRVWHFQDVKHDLWDRDFDSVPVLVTVKRHGHSVDAVVATTKSGFVFVFDRKTGKPLFPIEYRKVPASDTPGEQAASTQPFPLLPPPLTRQEFTDETVTNRTPKAHKAVLAELQKLRHGGQFIPPSFAGTIVFPGSMGGAEWGGPAFDPKTHLLYVNSNSLPKYFRLVPRPKPGKIENGRTLYLSNCSSCHKSDLSGNPPEFPSLKNIGSRYTETEVADIVRKGGGRMPSFTGIGDPAVKAIAAYVTTGEEKTAMNAWPSDQGPFLQYRIDGYNKFLDPDGYPANKPPWGMLTAIDLNTGKFVWRHPFGEYPELAAKGMTHTGCQNFGGPLVTAGGVLFIGATDYDHKFRAFDKATGKLLWETTLPFAGNATPATYEVNGRQYVVIAAGGGEWGAPSGDTYVAFALP